MLGGHAGVSFAYAEVEMLRKRSNGDAEIQMDMLKIKQTHRKSNRIATCQGPARLETEIWSMSAESSI